MSVIVNRSNWLDVWTAPFRIPISLLEIVGKTTLPYLIRKMSGVEPYGITFSIHKDYKSICGLLCDGYCGWHEDSHLDNPYSALLVLRNDTGAWVEAKRCPINRAQPIGTLIWLDLRREHRLNQVRSARGKVGVYLAATLDAYTPWSRERVEAEYRRVLGIE